MPLHSMAGKPAPRSFLIEPDQLLTAYKDRSPNPDTPEERVQFGTSGHRGSSLKKSFNEAHILAVTQALCEHRQERNIDGPLFLVMDTHALSEPALFTALGVLAANGVDVMLDAKDRYVPTPALSHAILAHNRGRTAGFADGVVMTPSHNPPSDGGFKYNPPHGGPAGASVTSKIETRANELLKRSKEIPRKTREQALAAPTTRRYDFVTPYIDDLKNIVDLGAISKAGLKMGVDPLGGAGVSFWGPIAERYQLDITVVNDSVDPTFSFMCVDHDGKIRMDCSPPYAMAGLVALKEHYDIAFGNDADGDRHGVVTKSSGLLNPNHYLSVAAWYLLKNRPDWSPSASVGKTLVTSSMIDRVVENCGRQLYEVPVGFKWFVDALHSGRCVLGCEESAGASFLRNDGTVWSTDKDGIILALLAAEITAKCDRDPGEIYQTLTQKFGAPIYARIDSPASPAQKKVLKALSPNDLRLTELAGEPVQHTLTEAPGNGAAVGGLKVMAKNGWFAARPSGTEDIYKIYAESFIDSAHLRQIQDDAKQIVSGVFAAAGFEANI